MRDESAEQLMRLLLMERGIAVPEEADAETLLRLALGADPVPASLAGALAEIFDAASDLPDNS